MAKKWILVLVMFCPLAWAGEEPTLVYLVRHTEKVDESSDADLSETGLSRAAQIRYFFAKVDLDQIFATQFQRTQKTVAPTAKAHGLEVQIIDARDPNQQIAQVRAHPGKTHLIAGHSNTVPALIALLGGPEVEIGHDEYDHIFLLIIHGERTVLQTYQMGLTPGKVH